MNQCLNDLRQLAVAMNIVSGKKSKQLHKKTLCTLLGLSCDKPYKYGLTNIANETATDWASIYQLAKMCNMNGNNFFYHMKNNKPILIGNELYTISKIPEDEIEIQNQKIENEINNNVFKSGETNFSEDDETNLIEFDDDGELIGMRD